MNRCLGCLGSCQQGRLPCDCRPDPAEAATEIGNDTDDARDLLGVGAGVVLIPAATVAAVSLIALVCYVLLGVMP